MKSTKIEETKITKENALEKIEEERALFFKKYKLHDVLKKVVFAVCFIIMLFALFVIPKIMGKENKNAAGVQLGIAFAALMVMLVYGVVVKKLIDVKLANYFRVYYNCINLFTLSKKGITNVVMQEPSKIQKQDLVESDLYVNLFEVGSRGLTNFEYNSIQMSICECAGQIKGDKRIQPVFVGKYLRAESSYKSKDTMIIYLKGEGLVLPPTNIEDKKVAFSNEKMVIYTNNKDFEKVLTPAVKKALESIKTNKLLVDLAISLKEGKQFVAMGYDDPLMVPPLQQPFNQEPTKQFSDELDNVLKLMEALY